MSHNLWVINLIVSWWFNKSCFWSAELQSWMSVCISWCCLCCNIWKSDRSVFNAHCLLHFRHEKFRLPFLNNRNWWFILRVNLATNDILTPFDLRAQTFRVNVELPAFYRGQKFFKKFFRKGPFFDRQNFQKYFFEPKS